MSVESDLEIITRSLRMLPPWTDQEWWRRFTELARDPHDEEADGFSLQYLNKKLGWITSTWEKVGALAWWERASTCCSYSTTRTFRSIWTPCSPPGSRRCPA